MMNLNEGLLGVFVFVGERPGRSMEGEQRRMMDG
jgi:hypothetical protein